MSFSVSVGYLLMTPKHMIKQLMMLTLNAYKLVLMPWSKKWLSFFNTEKCKSLHLGKNNTNHVYNMTVNNVSTPLGITTCEKDLGVYVDSNLNFNEHISTVIKKAKNMCYLILRTISFKSPEIMCLCTKP